MSVAPSGVLWEAVGGGRTVSGSETALNAPSSQPAPAPCPSLSHALSAVPSLWPRCSLRVPSSPPPSLPTAHDKRTGNEGLGPRHSQSLHHDASRSAVHRCSRLCSTTSQGKGGRGREERLWGYWRRLGEECQNGCAACERRRRRVEPLLQSMSFSQRLSWS